MTIVDTHILPHVVGLAKKLIAIPSTEDNPEAMANVLAIAKKELQGFFPIEEFEKNGVKSLLVHNTTQRTKHFKVILNAHLDVIPAPREHYRPYEKDGRLYGRGSYDMKAAAAAMMLLFRQIGNNLSYPVALQIVTDEETGSFNGTAHQLEKGLRTDFVITGEGGSNFIIKNEAKGILWVKLTARGIASHGAYPWLAKNPILRMQEIIALVKDHYPVPTEPVWQTVASFTNVETSNTVVNRIPSDCSATIDIRYVQAEADTIMEKLRALIPDDIEIDILQHAPAAFTDSQNEYIGLLQEHTERILGRKTRLGGAYAAADIRLYTDLGCSGVEFGPLGANHHSDYAEWVDIASLEQYYVILRDFLLALNN